MFKTALILLTGASSFACPKFFQPFLVPNTAFEKTPMVFTENEFGPQIDGLNFHVGGKTAVGVFYGGRKKQWCAVLKDKKEGTSLDCQFFNQDKAGTAGGPLITVSAPGKAPTKPVAFALHTEGEAFTIFTIDPSKPLNKKDPMTSVDSSKAEIVLRGRVDVNNGSSATASLDVTVWDVATNKSLGKASHSVKGQFASASAQISRHEIRQNGPPPPIKPLQPLNLAGQMYVAPLECGFGAVSAYTAPADEGKDRIPAESK
jgi:hypothetical protein